MRNNLPITIRKVENGIVNLDNQDGPGTHWTAYVKHINDIIYFDSFGNLRPPAELIDYFLSDGRKNNIYYNHDSYQSYNSSICGQLCLEFLYNNT